MMEAKQLFEEIRHFCSTHANEDVVKKYSRYFKEGFDSYGISQELFTSKKKEILDRPGVSLELILETAKLLIPTGKYEETSFALILSDHFKSEFDVSTFTSIESWYSMGIINWGHTDYICSELLPWFLEKNLLDLKAFAAWRKSSNKFQRRSVPVTFIKPLKKGFEPEPFLTFIEPLMMDSERVVHQGLGWFLRETWKLHPEICEEFLHKWKNKAARLIFQYATEKMSKEYRMAFRKEKK